MHVHLVLVAERLDADHGVAVRAVHARSPRRAAAAARVAHVVAVVGAGDARGVGQQRRVLARAIHTRQRRRRRPRAPRADVRLEPLLLKHVHERVRQEAEHEAQGPQDARDARRAALGRLLVDLKDGGREGEDDACDNRERAQRLAPVDAAPQDQPSHADGHRDGEVGEQGLQEGGCARRGRGEDDEQAVEAVAKADERHVAVAEGRVERRDLARELPQALQPDEEHEGETPRGREQHEVRVAAAAVDDGVGEDGQRDGHADLAQQRQHGEDDDGEQAGHGEA
mmetsp:Transcript_26278/g.91399  ORF Transcript_26278/g.91399 Transcript_26278/m.91399 type:complete len:283 (-) Transcript_26278:516-1364(-)